MDACPSPSPSTLILSNKKTSENSRNLPYNLSSSRDINDATTTGHQALPSFDDTSPVTPVIIHSTSLKSKKLQKGLKTFGGRYPPSLS
jgi:hypothetical protein